MSTGRAGKVCCAVVVVLVTAAAGGCAHVRNALQNTAADATDVVRADVSGSFGTDMGAHVMATKLLQLKSYSYEDLYRVGLGMRHIGVWKEDREDWWIGPWHGKQMHIRSTIGEDAGPALAAKLRSGKGAPVTVISESPDEIGVGLHAFVAGFRVGARPWEFFDFLVSPLGFDPCNDNLGLEERRALREATYGPKRGRQGR